MEEVDANTFRLAAIPVTQGVTGNRSFFIDQGGEITSGIGGIILNNEAVGPKEWSTTGGPAEP